MGLSDAARELGTEGGKARAKKLTPEQRSAIAKKAVNARIAGKIREKIVNVEAEIAQLEQKEPTEQIKESLENLRDELWAFRDTLKKYE